MSRISAFAVPPIGEASVAADGVWEPTRKWCIGDETWSDTHIYDESRSGTIAEYEKEFLKKWFTWSQT